MSVLIELECKYCKSKNLKKNGKSSSGEQRYFCLDCKKTMQLKYLRNGDKPEIKEKIIKMAHNGNGVRQTSRILEISINTVMKELKKTKIFRS